MYFGKGIDMIYYCKIVDDDESYKIHGPYTLEELKYYISIKEVTVQDWFAKLNETDAANKPLKIKMWLPSDTFQELRTSFYPPWSMIDIMFSTPNSKNVPTFMRAQIALCFLGFAIIVGMIYYSWRLTRGDIGANVPVSQVEADAILASVRNQGEALNRKDIKGSLVYIHPEVLQKTEEMTEKIYSVYDLHSSYSRLVVESVSFDEAKVRFSMTTERIKGPAFRDNTIEGVHTLKKHNGLWKIYTTAVTSSKFLN